MRKINFQTGNYYHIYNRGVDKRDIFVDDRDFVRFIVSMREFNRIETIDSLYRLNYLNKQKPPGASKEAPGGLVEFLAYCLNSNHFHFILRQKEDNGISTFMQKVQMGHANYFNYKYNRSGSLFQGRFKAKHINTDSYLLKLSCYINGNPEIHKICKAQNWKWSSNQDYLSIRNGTMCDKNIILKDFKDIHEYKKLTDYIISDSSEIKGYVLE